MDRSTCTGSLKLRVLAIILTSVRRCHRQEVHVGLLHACAPRYRWCTSARARSPPAGAHLAHTANTACLSPNGPPTRNCPAGSPASMQRRRRGKDVCCNVRHAPLHGTCADPAHVAWASAGHRQQCAHADLLAGSAVDHGPGLVGTCALPASDPKASLGSNFFCSLFCLRKAPQPQAVPAMAAVTSVQAAHERQGKTRKLGVLW